MKDFPLCILSDSFPVGVPINQFVARIYLFYFYLFIYFGKLYFLCHYAASHYVSNGTAQVYSYGV